MTIDRLDEVRSVARAKAREDFTFFCNSVLGVNYHPDFCSSVQRRVESGEEVVLSDKRRERALNAWLSVLGRRDLLRSSPCDSFTFLFHDYVARSAEVAA